MGREGEGTPGKRKVMYNTLTCLFLVCRIKSAKSLSRAQPKGGALLFGSVMVLPVFLSFRGQMGSAARER